MVGLALVATGAVVAAFLSGESFLESARAVPEPAGADPRGARRAHLGLRGLLALAGVAVLVQVVLTGDAGSRAVWGTSAG